MDPVDTGFQHVDGEDRWMVVGHTAELRVIVVIFTMRGSRTRPVTAWDAPRIARFEYLKTKGWR
jgi:uncharacterized DUF497 family protein